MRKITEGKRNVTTEPEIGVVGVKMGLRNADSF
jgi:hypothetical protein